RDIDERGQVGPLIPEMELVKENAFRRVICLEFDVEGNERAVLRVKVSPARLKCSRAAVVSAAAFPFRRDGPFQIKRENISRNEAAVISDLGHRSLKGAIVGSVARERET